MRHYVDLTGMLSSMCSYRSYNLDHYDHVRFRRENEEVLIETGVQTCALPICYRSYNLDYYDHVRFRRENEEVLIEHQESCMFSL